MTNGLIKIIKRVQQLQGARNLKNKNEFRTVVSQVSPFVGNPVTKKPQCLAHIYLPKN